MIKGQLSRGKNKKKPNMVKFSLMANIHRVYEPQVSEEETGKTKWEKAMATKHESLMKNQTQNLTDLPSGEKSIGCKQVYKVKYKADDMLDKYKAQLIAKGFSRREGVDYEKTFGPTTKMSTIKLVLAMVERFH
jgi:hypothetical protein